MDTEEWRTVVIDGEEWSDYEVSSHGRVRSLNYRHTGQVKELKQRNNGHGYLFINLCKNGKYKMCYVHRVVATMFIPNPYNKPTVNHIDEDKTNNHVSNLEWADMKEQVNYGTRTERSAKAHGKRVLCVETNTIYDSIAQASRETGLSHGNICQCCKGQIYKTVGGFHWKYVDDTEDITEESENLIYYYYKPLTLVA